MQGSERGHPEKRKVGRYGGRAGGDIMAYPFGRHGFFVVRDVGNADPLVDQRDGAVADAKEEELEERKDGER